MQTSKNIRSNSTAGTSTLAEERSFDAWGRLRNPTNWSYTSVPAMSLTYRGFTGHEHLLAYNIINMNGRVYDPVVARFMSPDNYIQAPNNTQSFNRYSYVLNNPLKYTDPTGWVATDPGYSWWRTTKFILRYPIIAQNIGYYEKGSQNISTNAQRFAGRLGFTPNNQIAVEGNAVNAFRHVMWQSQITAQYGEGIAKQAGDAHEDNPDAATGSNFKTSFSTLLAADETIDLMNNIIGRAIGNATKGEDMQFRALVTLEYFKENGLWTATPTTDSKGKITGYTIGQTMLTQEQYDNAKKIIGGLNANGRTADEQKAYDNKIKEAQENMKSMAEGTGY